MKLYPRTKLKNACKKIKINITLQCPPSDQKLPGKHSSRKIQTIMRGKKSIETEPEMTDIKVSRHGH